MNEIRKISTETKDDRHNAMDSVKVEITDDNNEPCIDSNIILLLLIAIL